ncbi:unnamed protein product [Cyprideis torosa]|uniref:Uncharacterized protein n=1 Tax=Cyprideis torosa TaxID=163714 RepID=A0A7R8WHA4_9CRUS|nr:unnamed protein product [Cyprideis torosa]CAG0893060.1 unnamed protein product [Cyprideis torosa]
MSPASHNASKNTLLVMAKASNLLIFPNSSRASSFREDPGIMKSSLGFIRQPKQCKFSRSAQLCPSLVLAHFIPSYLLDGRLELKATCSATRSAFVLYPLDVASYMHVNFTSFLSGEFMTFTSNIVVERTELASRQSVKEGEYMCHAFVREDRLAGVVLSDHEYPPR